MFPSGGAVTGFNPNSGSNSFVDSAVEALDGSSLSNPKQALEESYQLDRSKDALSQLFELGKTDPAYMETYLQLLAERENTANAQKWYERMSDSQYQRAYKDLEKAGINPYLALQSLGGAGSGSVAPAGSWSSSPYANKVSKQQADSQRMTAASNIVKALLGAGTAITAILALLI